MKRGDELKLNKKILFLIFALILSSIFGVSTHARSFSWYCKRVADNKQPPLPAEFTMINDCSVLWINSKKEGDSDKVAYLTFDAGYENGNVEKILDTLKDKNVPGAFFILENLIDRNPELVLRMRDEGHFVCNHTATHKDVSVMNNEAEFAKELNGLNNKYKELTGEELKKYFRPPEGKFSKESLIFTKNLGYKTVFWSFAYADWDNTKQPSAEYAKKKIYDNIHNGCVLLLHPTSAVNAEILGDVIDHMRSEGYTFDDLSLEMGK